MQRPPEIDQTIYVCARTKNKIEIRQTRLALPLHSGSLVLARQRRIEPDDFLAAPLQILHLALEQAHIAAVPAVADDHDDGPMRYHARRKIAIESVQRAADIGAAGPAKNAAGDLSSALTMSLGTNEVRESG